MLRTGGNVLLLDEPTNDLDVDTLRALEDALEAFPGCAVVISHDRWFLDRIATHVLAFEGDSAGAVVRGQLLRLRDRPQARSSGPTPSSPIASSTSRSLPGSTVSAADARLRTVSPPCLVRVVVAVVCAACIAGLIGSSIADETHLALTFGLVGAVAALGLILVSAGRAARPRRLAALRRADREAAEVERGVAQLVAAGADETAGARTGRRATGLGRKSR